MEIDKNSSNTPLDSTKKVQERRALGRGLAALIGEDGSRPSANGQPEREVSDPPILQVSAEKTSETGRIIELPIQSVRPNAEQPRQSFNEAKLNELADSIREQGLIQPILVRKISDKNYQIIAGERRWRASKIAGLENIPAIIKDEKLETHEGDDLASLIENIQREELNPVELARAYGRMLSKYDLTQDKLSKSLGVSRVSLANTLRLLRLPDEVKKMVEDSRLSEGHARALLSLQNEEEISGFARRVLNENLSVRDIEARVRAHNSGEGKEFAKPQAPSQHDVVSYQKSAHLLALEDELRQRFGTKVQIRGSERRGSIELFFSGQDSFNRILHELRKPSR